MKARKLGAVAAIAAMGMVWSCTAPADDDEIDEPIASDVGVTAEPCPAPVNDDNGCIYLGVIADLTEGPFAAQNVEATQGQRAFWTRVNEAGGIGGYDVDIDTYTRDNRSDTDEQLSKYDEISGNVLAINHSLGGARRAAVLEAMETVDLIGSSGGWWSSTPSDRGIAHESGASWCVGAQIGLDWVSDEIDDGADDDSDDTGIETVVSVGYGSPYGADVEAGVAAWADAHDAEFEAVEIDYGVPVSDEAVEALLEAEPDAIVLAVGPAEAGDLVVSVTNEGFRGQFVGTATAFSEELMRTEAAEALLDNYVQVAAHEGVDGESAAHQAMRSALGDIEPGHDAYAAGWISAYPLLAVLEAAVADEDLTRANVRALVTEVEVNYEDALPSEAFVPPAARVDADEVAAVIAVPDEDAPRGLVTVDANVTADIDTAAC